MQWADFNGVSLRYDISGTGPLLVLLHEIGGSLESWDGVMSRLTRSYRVLRYDQRGSGLSEKPRKPFGMAELVQDLSQLIDHATDATDRAAPLHIAGCAFGAAQAAVLAAGGKHEIGSLIMCSPALTVDPGRADFMRKRSDLAEAQGMRHILPQTLARSWPDALRIQDADSWQLYQGRYLANDPTSFAAMNRALSDVTSVLPGIECPVLLVAGLRDLVRPPEGVRAVARHLKDSRYVELDAAHFIPVQAADALAEQMEIFLAEMRCRAEAGVVQ